MNSTLVTPQARAIARELHDCTATGRRPAQVFSDFLHLALVSLEMLPAHLESALRTGRLATDSAETAAIFDRMAAIYKRRHTNYLSNFARCLGHLLSGDLYTDANPDHVGATFEELALSNFRTGQFFTPWNICVAMADMAAPDLGRQALERLLVAALGEATDPGLKLIAGVQIMSEPLAANGPLFSRWLPRALERGFTPLSVCDPAVGSGRMLLAAARTAPAWMHHLGLIQFYGQDIDQDCVRMARLNCLLYGLNGWGARCLTGLSPEAAAAWRALPPITPELPPLAHIGGQLLLLSPASATEN